MQKQFSKILTTIFLLVFIFQLAGLIFLLTIPEPSQAVDTLDLQIDIGNTDKITFDKSNPSTKPIGVYIQAIYKYAIGIVGILAAVVLMFGGVMWLTAGGNAERVGNAKSWIGAALTGLVLTLASYTILYTVNPDLVNFKITKIQNVKESKSGGNKNCCQCTKDNKTYCTPSFTNATCKTSCESRGTGYIANLIANTDCSKIDVCIYKDPGCCKWILGSDGQTYCSKEITATTCIYYYKGKFIPNDANCEKCP